MRLLQAEDCAIAVEFGANFEIVERPRQVVRAERGGFA